MRKKLLLLLTLLCIFGLFFIGCQKEKQEKAVQLTPIEGNWVGREEGVGYFEFTNTEFKWYQTKDNLDDNYFYRTYTVEEGALRNNGKYDYGEEGKEIFTIKMLYQGAIIDKKDNNQESDGAFTVQRDGSPDKFIVKNHRTNGWFHIERE